MRTDRFFKHLGQSEVVYQYFHDNELADCAYDVDLKGFDTLLLDMSIVLQDPVLRRLHDIHPIEYAGILKMKPMTWYDWHVDTGRLCTVNMPLYPTTSHSLFKTGKAITAKQQEVVELRYQPKQLYLYNTSTEHAVLNLDSGDRFLFSLHFKNQKHYNEVLQLIS